MKEEYNVKCVIHEKEINGIIQTYERKEDVEIILKVENIVITEQADNFFDALIKIRKELENREIKLLCKGCCKNVYPSGMLLGMGSGRKAYLLTINRQAEMSSLVDIFEACSIKEYASVEEQENFFNKWCDSIGEL
ncbi:MAG: hypothetical protein OSJ60_19785 [Lachnospiraceae bacterium]|nr:hypothetical protein [Lachnospiraceae bacterium]